MAPGHLADLVATAYAIADVEKSVLLAQGANDTYLVSSRSAHYVARIYRHGWKSHEEIVAEIEYVTYLANNSAAVARFLPAKSGALTQILQCPEGTRFLVLMECASGSPREDHAVVLGNSVDYGRSIGLLHKAAADFQPQRTRCALDIDALILAPLRAVEMYFPEKTSALDDLRKLAGILAERINRLDIAGLKRLFLHGDLTGGNANMNSSGVYTFFDFDCCGWGWQAYDLAVFLWSLMQNNRLDLWQGFLQGYRTVAEIDRLDEEAIGLLVAARGFWIMGYSLSRIAVSGSLTYKPAMFAGDVQFLKNLNKALPENLRFELK